MMGTRAIVGRDGQGDLRDAEGNVVEPWDTEEAFGFTELVTVQGTRYDYPGPGNSYKHECPVSVRLWACPRCGAAVADTDQHMYWHEPTWRR